MFDSLSASQLIADAIRYGLDNQAKVLLFVTPKPEPEYE